MVKLLVNEIKGGEILAKPICTRENDIILPKGAIVKKVYISKLKDLGINEIYVKDNQNHSKDIPVIRSEVHDSVKESIKNLILRANDYNQDELLVLSDAVDNVIDDILSEDQVVEKILDIKERSTDLFEHSVNVCSYSVLTGIKMNLNPKVVKAIGVGALLHDIGLKFTATNFANKTVENLDSKEADDYTKHPIYGYSLIQDEEWPEEISKQIILCHHERIDGKGFPLNKIRIPMECQIVSVCDAFDEMICGISCIKVKYYEAIQYLKTYAGIKFDKKVVDVFLSFVAVYPTGSKVLTSEGEIGIVVKQNVDFLDCPILHILVDKNGKNIDKRVIKNLAELPDVYIVQLVEERR